MKNDMKLNAEQEEAVRHLDGPLLIIAGAGTGKTTVITERIKYLITKKNIPASEILALTFTEKAAREMEERIDIAVPYGYTQMWTLTFHAFCDRILRDEAVHIGFSPAFRLSTEAEAILFLRKNIFTLDLKYFRPLGNPHKFLDGLLTHFNRLKDDDISPSDYLSYAQKLQKQPDALKDEVEKTRELAIAYRTYEELKAKEGIMDFSDLIANTLRLFRTRPHILASYQKKFQHILVDEFQDTNFAQNELAVLLSGERKNIAVVGDDDQAIYRWRGAAIANIVQFKKYFPKAKIVTLTKNYRSTEEILQKSYRLIQNNNPDRLEVKESIDKQLRCTRNIKGVPVQLLFSTRVEQEADSVTEKIEELIVKQSLQYKDIAILVRANEHAQPFMRAFQRANIPFQFLGPGRLFHQEEIKDLIAYLKSLYNFEDNTSVYRVLTMSIFQLNTRDIAAIMNFAKKTNTSLFETLEKVDAVSISDESKEKVKEFVEMMHRHLKRVPRETAGQILYYFLEDSGLLKVFLQTKSAQEEKQALNIAKFFEKLKTYEATHDDASLFAVVDWIDLSMQLGESPLATDSDWSENNAVNILTVHSSKGLEFPAVFITNLVTQRFPTRDRKEQIPVPEDLIKETLPEGDYNLQEERRLFYVAMTRARDFLFLTASHYYGEGKRERKLSPFVIETLDEEAIEKHLKKHRDETSAEQLSLIDILQDAKKVAIQIEEAQKTEPHLVTYLSYSQINTFDTCPLHYKLKYILKIPSQPSPALSFGSSIHAVLRDYFQMDIREKREASKILEELLDKNWLNEGYSSKTHERQAFTHAKEVIKKFVVKNKGVIPLATEIPFLFSIDGLKIGGRIDRIDQAADGMIEIIDYKTGMNHPDARKLAADLQLTLYALAAKNVKDSLLDKSPEQILLSLLYVEDNLKFTTTRDAKQLEELKDFLLQKAKEISASDFACSITNCKNCEYKILCQAYG